MGIKTINIHSPFDEILSRTCSNYAQKQAYLGILLRFHIPEIIKNTENINEHCIYTDLDCMFLEHIDISCDRIQMLHCDEIVLKSEIPKDVKLHDGVIVLNSHYAATVGKSLIEFTKEKLSTTIFRPGVDQTILSEFFVDCERLDRQYHHLVFKSDLIHTIPMDRPKIVHFAYPKPWIKDEDIPNAAKHDGEFVKLREYWKTTAGWVPDYPRSNLL